PMSSATSQACRRAHGWSQPVSPAVKIVRGPSPFPPDRRRHYRANLTTAISFPCPQAHREPLQPHDLRAPRILRFASTQFPALDRAAWSLPRISNPPIGAPTPVPLAAASLPAAKKSSSARQPPAAAVQESREMRAPQPLGRRSKEFRLPA